MAGRDPRRRFQAAVAHPTVTDHSNVIQLRAAEAATEIALEAAAPPIYLDTTPAEAVQRRPIIPVALHRRTCAAPSARRPGSAGTGPAITACARRSYLLAVLWHALRGARG